MGAIVVRDLSKKFRRHQVLQNLNLEIQEGEFFVLMGLENSGKTTLTRILMNYLKPTTGSCTIFDMDTRKESDIIKELTGFVPEDVWIYDNFKPKDIFKATLNFHDSINTDEIQKLREYFELETEEKFVDLNDEDRKKVAIINALITKPKLLILDEPTKGLSKRMQVKLFQHLKTLQTVENVTILLLTDNLSEGQLYGDRVAYLSDGHVLETEFIKDKDTFDKVLKIYDDAVDKDIFLRAGAVLMEEDDYKVEFFYNKYLPNLTAILYQERLENYVLEDASLTDKIRSYELRGEEEEVEEIIHEDDSGTVIGSDEKNDPAQTQIVHPVSEDINTTELTKRASDELVLEKEAVESKENTKELEKGSMEETKFIPPVAESTLTEDDSNGTQSDEASNHEETKVMSPITDKDLDSSQEDKTEGDESHDL